MGSKNGPRCVEITLLLGGIFLISLGLAVFIFLTPIYEFILNQALSLNPDSVAFNAWRTNDPPLDLDLYLFNWTNPEQIHNSSVKPCFKEMGPYRVKEVKEKTNITWHNNDTVSYKVKKIYNFIPENSPGQLDDDVVTTINAVPLTVAWQGKNDFYLRRRTMSLAISSLSKMYVQATARDILFNGYYDQFLSVVSKFPGLDVQDKFGIFYGRNDTIGDGIFSMYTKNDNQFGRQLTWNYKNTTDFYKDHCNDIKGSATEFYPLNIDKTTLVFYSSELCKYAELEFVREETIKGVLGYRFTGDNIFDNGTLNPENQCFCGDECIPSGVLDVSKCRQNSPSFLSFPHFYSADPYYRSIIDGMEPNKTRHEFFIVIEPKTGIIMDIGANMQLNMLLQPVDGFMLYRNVPKIFLPMFYFSQHVGLTDELAVNLRMIQSIPEYLTYTSFVFGSLGVLLLIWCACSRFNVCSPKKQEHESQFEEIPLKR